MWLQGKYPTALKSVCSPWTLVKFIAFFRQIAVNEIAAFWLDTDRKKIMLKKIIAPIHHLFVISRLVCCNSSPWGRHGKYYLHLPGPDSRKKCHDTTYCWMPTLLAKGSTWVSGQQKEGLFFFSLRVSLFLLSLSPSSWDTLIPLFVWELSQKNWGSFQVFRYPWPPTSPRGPTDHYASKPMFMATLLCFSTLLGGRRKIVARGRGGRVEMRCGCRHYPSTAGASSLHEQGRNIAQLGSGARQATGLGWWMPPPHGILVPSSFMCTWNHSAPRASVPWSSLTALWKCSEVQLVMTRGLVREEGHGCGAVWLPLPSPSPGVPDSATAWWSQREASRRLEWASRQAAWVDVAWEDALPDWPQNDCLSSAQASGDSREDLRSGED